MDSFLGDNELEQWLTNNSIEGTDLAVPNFDTPLDNDYLLTGVEAVHDGTLSNPFLFGDLTADFISPQGAVSYMPPNTNQYNSSAFADSIPSDYINFQSSLVPLSDDSLIDASNIYLLGPSDVLEQNSQQSEPISALPPPASPSSEKPTEDGGESSDAGRKRRRRMLPHAKRRLEECFERHRDDPYLPQEQINQLATDLDLSVKQVRTFFANARARKLPRAVAGVDVPGAEKTPQDPMERFLSASPEDEGLSEDVVQKAAKGVSPIRSSSIPKSGNDAVSVSDSAFSSNSDSSLASMDSVNSRGPRRGRKRRREPSENTDEPFIRAPRDNKLYQCTFCTSNFSQKFDWKRHEESVHLPQVEWVCMPTGTTYEPEGETRCVFCDEKDPDDSHSELHGASACISAPHEQRAFLRKDKLVQHLMQVHGCKRTPKAVKEWCRPIERVVTMICGLCGCVLHDWAVRAAHISSHFIDGIAMDRWLLDKPGGIIQNASPEDEAIKRVSGGRSTANGLFPCEHCSERFESVQHRVFHRRQVHNAYSEHDKDCLRVSENTAPLTTDDVPVGPGRELPQRHGASGQRSRDLPAAVGTGMENLDLQGKRRVPFARVMGMPLITGVPTTRRPLRGPPAPGNARQAGETLRLPSSTGHVPGSPSPSGPRPMSTSSLHKGGEPPSSRTL